MEKWTLSQKEKRENVAGKWRPYIVKNWNKKGNHTVFFLMWIKQPGKKMTNNKHCMDHFIFNECGSVTSPIIILLSNFIFILYAHFLLSHPLNCILKYKREKWKCPFTQRVGSIWILTLCHAIFLYSIQQWQYAVKKLQILTFLILDFSKWLTKSS